MSKTTMIVPSAPKTGAAFNSHTAAKWSPIKSQDHKIASPAGAGLSPFGNDKRNDKYANQSESASNWGPFKNREHFNQMHFC